MCIRDSDHRPPIDPAATGAGARTLARDLRLRLMREHLDRRSDDDLVDPQSAIQAMTTSAKVLEAWHRRGRVGARPPGRLMPHAPEPLGRFTRLWATLLYRYVYDPDGRPRGARGADRW